MLFGLTVMIFSQHVHISKHQVVQLKYMQFFIRKKPGTGTTMTVLSVLPALITSMVSTFLRKK